MKLEDPVLRWMLKPALMIAGVAAIGFAGVMATKSDGPPPVQASQSSAIVARGRIEPVGRVIALHGPAEGGVVEALKVEQNDKVTAGQVVAVLDGYELRKADLAVAEANKKLAELQREQTIAGAKNADLAAQSNVVSARTAQVARTRSEWERRSALFQRNVIAQQSLDQSKAEFDQAQSELEQASNVLRALTETRSVDEAVASARISVEAANVERSRAQLGRMLVKAPGDGTILSLQTRAGEVISPDGILRMAAVDAISVVAEIGEVEAPRVRMGMEVEVASPALSSVVKGRVERIGQEVFRQKRPSSDILIGRDARIVEVEVSTERTLGLPIGSEVLIRISSAEKLN